MRPPKIPRLMSSGFPPLTDTQLYTASALQYTVIAVCLQLTINCAVSFRAVPKILALFQELLRFFGVHETIRIPHFTTVIRWNLRVGVALLAQSVKEPLSPWICIIDHTIQVGTKKAFVVLQVPLNAVRKAGALSLQDLNVLSISVRDSWNGQSVKEVLDKLFCLVGDPLQVVADGGPDLQKGLRLLRQCSHYSFKLTADITHLIANLLKRKYQHHATFKNLLLHLAQSKKKVLQTSLGYLAPLKERSKARFLNLPSIAKWTKQVIDYINALPSIPNKPDDELTEDERQQQKICSHFGWLFDYLPFLTQFWTEIQILSEFQKLLKNNELNEITVNKASTLLTGLHDLEIQKTLSDYLTDSFNYAMQNSRPVLLCSDSIESLFGKYKYLAKPHSMSEINRMIFTLPCICEKITPELIKESFLNVTHAEMEKRIQQEISETLLSKRRKAFSSQNCEEKITSAAFPSYGDEELGDSILMEYDGSETVGTPLTLTG